MREKGSSAFDEVVSNDNADEKPSKKNETEEASQPSNTTDNESSQPATQSGSADTTGDTHSNDTGNDVVESISDSTPAFPYSEVKQRPIYAREETWDKVEDLKYYADGELRESYNVRNAETREFDEALAELIIEELTPEQIAAKLAEIRGF